MKQPNLKSIIGGSITLHKTVELSVVSKTNINITNILYEHITFPMMRPVHSDIFVKSYNKSILKTTLKHLQS